MKKQYLYLLLSFLLLFGLLLVACGQNAAAPEEEAAPDEQETDAEVVDEAEAVEENEPVTLTYWHASPQPPMEPTTLEMVAAFEEEYPWIDVNVEGFPFGEYFTKLDTATAGGNAPDLFWVDVTEVPRYAFFETIIPLDEYLPDDYLSDWYEGPRNDMQYEGQVWAVPLHQSTEALLYNEDIVNEAGLTPPNSYEEAWSFDDFHDALETVTKEADDGTIDVWGFTTNYNLSVYNWQPWIYAQGGSFMDPEATTYDGWLDSEETADAAEWFAQLSLDNLAPVERIPDIFQTGKVAFFQSNPFGLIDIQNRYPDLNVGVTPIPCDVKCSVNSGGWQLGISSQSEHPQEAWLLLDFLTNSEGHTTWIENTGYMPARISVYESMPKLQEYPFNIFMEGLIDHADRRPVTKAYQFFNQTMTSAARDFNTGAPIVPSLEQVAEEAQSELENLE